MLDRLQYVPRSYLPLKMSDADSQTGPRMGGMPPTDVQPRYVDRNTRYLITLPIDMDRSLEVSLFFSFEPGIDHARSGPRTRRVLHGIDNTLVEAVVHSSSSRVTASELTASPDVPSRALIIGEPTLEPEDEGDPFFSGFSGDKMGGIPRYDQNKDPLFSDAQRAMDAGYVHFLQLDAYGMLGPAISWPFLNSVFHVWARSTSSNSYDFKFGWG